MQRILCGSARDEKSALGGVLQGPRDYRYRGELGADGDLDAGEGDVLLHSLYILIQGVVMGNQLLYGDAHFLSLLQEAQGGDVLVGTVDPGAHQVDLLIAQVEVGIHGAVACIDEEAHLAVTAATTDILISISRSLRNTGALEDKVCTEAVSQLLDLGNTLFDGLELTEVDDVSSTHFLGKCQTGIHTVNCNDIDNTGGLKNSDLHEADGATALYQDGGAEVNDIQAVSTVPGVDTDTGGLDKHSLIQGHVVDNKDRGVLTDQDVFCKPTVKVDIVLGYQTVNAQVLTEVGQLRIATAVVALTAQEDRSNNLITDLDGVTLGIRGNALTHGNDLAGTLVAQNNRSHAEGIIAVFVNIGAADATALYLDQDLTGTGSGDLMLAELNDCLALYAVNLLGLNQICQTRFCHNKNLIS